MGYSLDSDAVIEALEELFEQHGAPENLGSDNGAHIPQLRIDHFSYHFDAHRQHSLVLCRTLERNQEQVQDCTPRKALTARLIPPRLSHWCSIDLKLIAYMQ